MHIKKLLISFAALAGCVLTARPEAFRENPEKYGNFSLLSQTPEFREAPFEDSREEGLQALMITGYGKRDDDKDIHTLHPKPLSKKNKAEFFAYMGFPRGPVPDGGFPGIVLIHGGGGTAYPKYVKYWISKGYAVIAPDWYNRRPVRPDAPGGKVGRAPLPGGKRQDHVVNVANIVLAHSLLSAQKNVNPAKTAFVGLSWGSWYGAIVAAVVL